MPRILIAIFSALALQSVALAGDVEFDEKTDTLRMSCRDGQKPTEMLDCDTDGKADGTCTFGHPGKDHGVTVRVGETRELVLHSKGILKCRAASEAAGAPRPTP